eukprot:3206322-Pyramimonas_sp.AAC.1
MTRVSRIPMIDVRCFRRTHDYEGATVTMIRGVEVPGMAFWHDLGSSSCNSPVCPRSSNTEKNLCGMLQGPQTVVFPRGKSLCGNEPL